MERILEFYENYRSKIKMFLIVFITIIVFLIIFYLIFSDEYYNDKNEVLVSEISHISSSLDIKNINEKENIIYVDIKGEIANAGVYSVSYGKRVIDVINEAGGLTENANTRFINLAKVLEDGEVIVIYSNSEIESAEQPNTVYVDVPCECEKIKNDACITSNISNDDSLININTASADELKTLDGIGDAKANNIIEYRSKNGMFNSTDEILNVSGISDAIYEKIKDKITVN